MNRTSEGQREKVGSLVYYEQRVNDRHFTSAAPDIPDAMLPEQGASLPLAWRRVAKSDASMYSNDEITFNFN